MRTCNHSLAFPKALVLTFLMLLLEGSGCAELSIHMLDVGQGDALLILCDGQSLLVDAGPEETGTFVHNYVSQRITDNQLDYVIATHGHADHLGGMTEALRGFSIGQIYTPAAIPMSYWLNHILPKTKGGSFTVNKPQPKETFTLGTATIQFLNVLTEAEIENDLSLVIRIDYENTSVLLTGDLEGAGEISLLEAGADLKADVLKVGHHGGNTSTSDAFLKSVHPRYALISVGKGNKHGHPHQEVLTRLAKNSITVYRTDQFGTIIMTSDGQDWKAEVMKTGK